MKRLNFMLTVFILMTLAMTVRAAEHYIQFRVDSKQELSKVGRVVSIDHGIIEDGIVHAYANDEELKEFISLGYDYTELPHPGTLIVPEMASSIRDAQVWDSYPTYETYVAMMYQFEANYPSICKTYDIGNSVQGRDILYVRISDNVLTEEDEPEVMFTSTMHGDETTGYVLMLRLIDSLLSTYGVDAEVTDMIDNMEIWINPLSNPDGTYHGGNNTVNGAQRYNANSRDLNRNFRDPQDGNHPDGASWQPETIAMMDFAEAHSFIISANHHGGAEVVNYPWDTWIIRHADDAWYQDVCHAWADSVHDYSPASYMDGFDNGITNGYDWYEVNGGRQDFMNYWQGCREITVELSNVKLLSPSQLPIHWVYNKVSFFDWFRNALDGIRGIVTDAVTGLPLAATISVIGHDEDSSEVYTDPDVGDYHRMIEDGTYDLVYSSPGYFPDTVKNISVAARSSVQVDVQLNAVPQIPLLAFESQDAGQIDPSDTVSFAVELRNDGAGDATNVVAILSTADTFVTIIQDNSSYPTIPRLGGTGTSYSNYVFEVAPSCPLQHPVSFALHITADSGYVDSTEFTMAVGVPIETFASGDFSAFTWVMSGNQPWEIATDEVYEGAYSTRNMDINNSQTSIMSVTMDDVIPGEISFHYKVSSEAGFDFLRFYIDGQVQGQWAGNIDWTEVTYPVTAGTHTFQWRYSKDASVSVGSDRAWVDYIVFPASLPADGDNDGVADISDNCLSAFNPAQEDSDFDTIGDSCDNCILTFNPSQEDADFDGLGDSCDYICGDVDGSFTTPNVADLTYMVAYLFQGGPPPVVLVSGDCDGSGGEPNVADLTYLVSFLFQGGPAPICN